jgi:hypothetical protein
MKVGSQEYRAAKLIRVVCQVGREQCVRWGHVAVEREGSGWLGRPASNVPSHGIRRPGSQAATVSGNEDGDGDGLAVVRVI